MSNPHLNSLKQNKGRKYGPSMGNSGPKTVNLSAHITEEAGWETSSSGNTLSRVFLVVLVLHVLVIGGIVGYEWLKPEAEPVAAATTTDQSAPPPKATPEPPKVTIHRLQSQESLDTLSSRYAVPVEYLIEYNDLNTNPMKPGMILHIPSTEMVAEYERKKAEQTALAQTNPVPSVPDQLANDASIGQEIVAAMPAVPAIAPTEQPITQPNSGALTEIPKAKPVVEIGTPGLPENPVQTLGQTAEEEPIAQSPPKMTQSTPVQTNGAERPRIPPAQAEATSEIPKAKPLETPTPPKTETKVNASGKTHKIASGETLFRISRMYKVNVNDLMKLNGISDPSKLQIGRVLKIPAK